jgi:hypothetical protein
MSNDLEAQTGETDSGGRKSPADGGSIIHHIRPDPRGGTGYKLVYLVNLPLGAYWKFKTDFDNEFLLTNKYIEHHRFIEKSGNRVTTENRYTNAPNVYFKWLSILFPNSYRIEFNLLNPDECRQKFHYGYIQAESSGSKTKVTHVAYFDFLGAALWAYYPWAGGMSDFLSYTARWEQETTEKLRKIYTGNRK